MIISNTAYSVKTYRRYFNVSESNPRNQGIGVSGHSIYSIIINCDITYDLNFSEDQSISQVQESIGDVERLIKAPIKS